MHAFSDPTRASAQSGAGAMPVQCLQGPREQHDDRGRAAADAAAREALHQQRELHRRAQTQRRTTTTPPTPTPLG